MLTTVLTKGAIYIYWTLSWTATSYYTPMLPYLEFKNRHIAANQNQCIEMASQKWEDWYLTNHGKNEYFYTLCTDSSELRKNVLIKCNYKGLCSTSYYIDSPDKKPI